MVTHIPSPSLVLDFWFAATNAPYWFAKDAGFDALVRKKFLKLYEEAVLGELDGWSDTPAGILALVLIFDQLPRNMFRDTPKAFATDARALQLTYLAIQSKMDAELSDAIHRHFLYMPLMHSEHIEDQKLSVLLFEYSPQAHIFAVQHYNIIKQFGRFPHRNKTLGRPSTEAEITFLAGPNSSF